MITKMIIIRDYGCVGESSITNDIMGLIAMSHFVCLYVLSSVLWGPFDFCIKRCSVRL